MKYVLLFTGTDEGRAAQSKEDAEAMYRRIGEWWGEHSQAGRILGGEELQPARTATTIRFKNGKPVVTDGPFLEAKERIGGFAIIEVPDLDAALDMAKGWPAGDVEVRPVVHEH